MVGEEKELEGAPHCGYNTAAEAAEATALVVVVASDAAAGNNGPTWEDSACRWCHYSGETKETEHRGRDNHRAPERISTDNELINAAVGGEDVYYPESPPDLRGDWLIPKSITKPPQRDEGNVYHPDSPPDLSGDWPTFTSTIKPPQRDEGATETDWHSDPGGDIVKETDQEEDLSVERSIREKLLYTDDAVMRTWWYRTVARSPIGLSYQRWRT